MMHVLTRKEVPDGSLLLWVSDVHIGIEHTPALKLMVECAEREGVTHVVAGGDIYDCHSISNHTKDPERILAQGTLRQEVRSGEWLTRWFSTRPTYFIAGNHEGRIDRFIAENPSLYGLTIKEVLGLPSDWVNLPVGAELRLGNLVMAHGNVEFARGTGGKYPAQRLLDMAPDQSTIAGHVHRIGHARRTSTDEHGVKRTRAGFTMGHMSYEHMHQDYAGRNPNWQNGFGLISVWYEDDRPRWTVTQVEVLFDRYNRPCFELNGRVYR